MRLGDVVSVVRGKHKGERGYIVALSQEGRTLEQLKEFNVYRKPTSQEAVLTNFDRTRCFIVRLNTLKHRQAICTRHKGDTPNDPVNSNVKLFLYSYRGGQEYDSYYCGCWEYNNE